MKPILKLFLVLLPILFLWTTISFASNYPPPPNIRITIIPQLNNEEQVFLCPTDSNILIANWRDFRLNYRQVGVGRSTDGGQTWVDSLISFDMQYFYTDSKQSDPTMTVDRQGNFYMSVLDWDAFGFTDGSIIAFYKSIDKGNSWTGPVPNISVLNPDIFEDKQFITVDRTGGPFDGNLYCSWTRFYAGPNRMLFVSSVDGGQSFEDTITVGPNQTSTGCGSSVIDAGQFSIPIVSSNGDVHVFWQGFALDSGFSCTGTIVLKHVVSSDGGQTFTCEDTVLSVSGYTTATGGINTYSQPAGDADITGGPFDGNIYISFTNEGPEDNNHTDIDFIRSTDNGLTWSNRYQINDALSSKNIDSFHPWLICNEEGILIVIFYDQRFDAPSFVKFDLLAAYSFDGGQTFTSNHRISTVSSSPYDLQIEPISPPWIENDDGSLTPVYLDPMAGLIGEYIGVTAFHDKINAVWTDSRDGNSEIYTANWQLPLLEPRLTDPEINSEQTSSTTFTWSTSWKHYLDRYRIEISPDINFISNLTTWIVDTNFYVLDTILKSGLNYWRVKTFNTAETDSSDYSSVRSINYLLCGDIDGNQTGPDIADLVYLVEYMFGTPPGPPPVRFELADVDNSGELDIADLVYLVEYMFGSPPGPSPTCEL